MDKKAIETFTLDIIQKYDDMTQHTINNLVFDKEELMKEHNEEVENMKRKLNELLEG